MEGQGESADVLQRSEPTTASYGASQTRRLSQNEQVTAQLLIQSLKETYAHNLEKLASGVVVLDLAAEWLVLICELAKQGPIGPESDLAFVLRICGAASAVRIEQHQHASGLESHRRADTRPIDLAVFRNATSVRLVRVDVARVVGLAAHAETLRQLQGSHLANASLELLLSAQKPGTAETATWTSLEQLTLQSSALEPERGNVLHLAPELRILDLSDVDMREIREDVASLHRLHTLVLARNAISTLTIFKNIYNNLQRLTNLDVSSNNITDVDGVQYLENLSLLDIRFNAIRHAKMLRPLSKLPFLRALNLDGNPVVMGKDALPPVIAALGDDAVHNICLDGNYYDSEPHLSAVRKILQLQRAMQPAMPAAVKVTRRRDRKGRGSTSSAGSDLSSSPVDAASSMGAASPVSGPKVKSPLSRRAARADNDTSQHSAEAASEQAFGAHVASAQTISSQPATEDTTDTSKRIGVLGRSQHSLSFSERDVVSESGVDMSLSRATSQLGAATSPQPAAGAPSNEDEPGDILTQPSTGDQRALTPPFLMTASTSTPLRPGKKLQPGGKEEGQPPPGISGSPISIAVSPQLASPQSPVEIEGDAGRQNTVQAAAPSRDSTDADAEESENERHHPRVGQVTAESEQQQRKQSGEKEQPSKPDQAPISSSESAGGEPAPASQVPETGEEVQPLQQARAKKRKSRTSSKSRDDSPPAQDAVSQDDPTNVEQTDASHGARPRATNQRMTGSVSNRIGSVGFRPLSLGPMQQLGFGVRTDGGSPASDEEQAGRRTGNDTQTSMADSEYSSGDVSTILPDQTLRSTRSVRSPIVLPVIQEAVMKSAQNVLPSSEQAQEPASPPKPDTELKCDEVSTFFATVWDEPAGEHETVTRTNEAAEGSDTVISETEEALDNSPEQYEVLLEIVGERYLREISPETGAEERVRFLDELVGVERITPSDGDSSEALAPPGLSEAKEIAQLRLLFLRDHEPYRMRIALSSDGTDDRSSGPASLASSAASDTLSRLLHLKASTNSDQAQQPGAHGDEKRPLDLLEPIAERNKTILVESGSIQGMLCTVCGFYLDPASALFTNESVCKRCGSDQVIWTALAQKGSQPSSPRRAKDAQSLSASQASSLVASQAQSFAETSAEKTQEASDEAMVDDENTAKLPEMYASSETGGSLLDQPLPREDFEWNPNYNEVKLAFDKILTRTPRLLETDDALLASLALYQFESDEEFHSMLKASCFLVSGTEPDENDRITLQLQTITGRRDIGPSTVLLSDRRLFVVKDDEQAPAFVAAVSDIRCLGIGVGRAWFSLCLASQTLVIMTFCNHSTSQFLKSLTGIYVKRTVQLSSVPGSAQVNWTDKSVLQAMQNCLQQARESSDEDEPAVGALPDVKEPLMLAEVLQTRTNFLISLDEKRLGVQGVFFCLWIDLPQPQDRPVTVLLDREHLVACSRPSDLNTFSKHSSQRSTDAALDVRLLGAIRIEDISFVYIDDRHPLLLTLDVSGSCDATWRLRFETLHSMASFGQLLTSLCGKLFAELELGWQRQRFVET